MYLGLALRLTRASSLRANTALTLDADAVFRGRTLDADAVIPRLQLWNNDPAYADRVGRYRAGGPYMSLQDSTFANIFTFGRASTATDFDAYGLLNTVASGNIRQGYSPATGAPLGWLLEGAATNWIPNPRAEGAVAPSTNPTGWFVIATNNNGVSTTIAGSGVSAEGIPYVDVSFAGTATADATFSLSQTSATAGGTVAVGQVWTTSSYVQLVAGSLAGFSYVRPCLDEKTAAFSFLVGSQGTNGLPTSAALGSQRYSYTRTLSSGTVGSLTPGVRAFITSGSTVSATIRIGAPQLEQNYFASSVILPPVSAPAATTRAADALSIDGPRFQQVFGLGRSVTNLLTQSDAFDNAAWAKSNATITANTGTTTAPDGTNTADKLVADATAAVSHLVRQTSNYVAGQTYTYSFYCKAGECTAVRLTTSSSVVAGSPLVNLDLTTGIATVSAAGLNPSVTALANGWYRFAITFTAATTVAATGVGINLLQNIGTSVTWDGDGTSGLYLWGAQLETAPATPAANLLTAPEAFDNAEWTKAACSISPNSATAAPDGTLSADKLVEDTATAAHNIWAARTLTTAGQYVVSFYAKAAGRTQIQIKSFNATDGNAIIGNADLTTGTVTNNVGGTVTATDVGNGWYRIVGRGTFSAVYTQTFITTVSGGVTSYQGDGSSGVLLWGANWLQASTAPAYVPLSALVSSYIPTTTAAVTKTGVTEGCVIVEAMIPQAALSASASQFVIQLSEGADVNRIALRNSVGGLGFDLYASNALGTILDTVDFATFTAGATVRIGLRWAQTGATGFVLSGCFNGGSVYSAPVAMPVGLNTLHIGNTLSGARPLNGRVRLVRALAFAPDDADFQARCTLGA